MGKRKKKAKISFTVEVDIAKEMRILSRRLVILPKNRRMTTKKGKKGYARSKGKAIPQD